MKLFNLKDFELDLMVKASKHMNSMNFPPFYTAK